MNLPRPQQLYRHFKGKLYQVLTLAEHTETGEELVIYQALYGDFKIYARPLSLFMGQVDRAKYPDAEQAYRFEPVEGKEPEAERKEKVLSKENENMQENLQKSEANVQDWNKNMQKKEAEGIFREEEGEEELSLDPLVLEFLDAGTYEERLNILAALHHRITDEMINTMAVSLDVEVPEGELEDRYVELRKCLLLFDKFECSRLR